jgi:hypothetical protein
MPKSVISIGKGINSEESAELILCQTRVIYMGITDDISTKVGKRAAERASKAGAE